MSAKVDGARVHFSLPEAELLGSGHLGCQGCGATLAMRYALKALGEKTIVVIPACCWTILAGPFPHSALKVPVLHTAFETAAVAASGVRAALDLRGDRETTVMAFAGDGGTFDIGLQSLSGACERNEDILYVCYDNEAYMNTGIQRSSATPQGAWTTTTPERKAEPKKDIMAIMAAHGIPYAATASIAFPEDLVSKLNKAKGIRGLRFVHLLSPCPPGWRIPAELSVELARLAVATRAFPLYDVEGGEVYKISPMPERRPVREYLEPQGRFSQLTQGEMEEIQRVVDRNWKRLQRRAENGAQDGD